MDETLRIAKSTALEYICHFAASVVAVFSENYLRAPTKEETRNLLLCAGKLGLPEMLGSIDRCKWMCKYCPTAHHGQFKGEERVPTVTMEAIANNRLYICHAF